MIDQTYGYLARNAGDYDRSPLDAFSVAEQTIGHVAGTISHVVGSDQDAAA